MSRAKVVVAGLTLWLGVSFVAHSEDNTIVTDNDIHKMFKSSREVRSLHDVMRRQRDRLIMILDGFIMGDAKIITQEADHFEEDIQFVSKNVKFEKKSEIEAWEAMSLIVKLSIKMKNNMLKKDFKKAFVDYSAITSQCVRCHEATRGWGTLEPEISVKVDFNEGKKDSNASTNSEAAKTPAVKSTKKLSQDTAQTLTAK